MTTLKTTAEFLTALAILSGWFWMPWAYYLVTGHVLNFG